MSGRADDGLRKGRASDRSSRPRALTEAENALVRRYRGLEASNHRWASWLVLPFGLGLVGFSFVVMGQSAGVGFATCMMGLGLMLLPHLVARLTRSPIELRAHRVRGVCSTQIQPKVGPVHFVGGSRVYLPLGWDGLWPEGRDAEIDVCCINAAGSLLALSLPDVSAEREARLAPLIHQGNGWLALNALALPLCFVTGLWLLATARDDARASGACFAVTLVTFVLSALRARARHRLGQRERADWRNRLATAAPAASHDEPGGSAAADAP